MKIEREDRPHRTPTDVDLVHLKPGASLNRRRLLVTDDEDRHLEGKQGHELFSAQALTKTISDRSFSLGVPDSVASASLLMYLSHLVESGNDDAISISERYGRLLGHFFASMNPSNTISETEDPWEKAYLTHWSDGITEVVLGGGLVSGKMGEVISHSSQVALDKLGKNLRVTIAANPQILPMIGAARVLSECDDLSAVVADFGHTSARTAIADFEEDGSLKALRTQFSIRTAEVIQEGDIAALGSVMIDIIKDTYIRDKEQIKVSPKVVCSIASYLGTDGQPEKSDVGYYTRLHSVSGNLDVSSWLSREISKDLHGGIDLDIVFAHDAQSAAAAYAGIKPPGETAVVMLGTYMGIGFVPDANDYRPISNDFQISKAA